MPDSGRATTPLPLAQAFVICDQIIEDSRTHDVILLRPFSVITGPHFPINFRMSFYAHLTCGHGSYDLLLELRDIEARMLWQWRLPKTMCLSDPLAEFRLTINDAVMEFPQPGRYDMVLLANGEELARHALHARVRPPR